MHGGGAQEVSYTLATLCYNSLRRFRSAYIQSCTISLLRVVTIPLLRVKLFLYESSHYSVHFTCLGDGWVSLCVQFTVYSVNFTVYSVQLSVKPPCIQDRSSNSQTWLLYYTILYYAILYFTILYYTILYSHFLKANSFA